MSALKRFFYTAIGFLGIGPLSPEARRWAETDRILKEFNLKYMEGLTVGGDVCVSFWPGRGRMARVESLDLEKAEVAVRFYHNPHHLFVYPGSWISATGPEIG